MINFSANGGELSHIVKILNEIHKKKDGTFVNTRAEQVYNNIQAKIIERQSQFSSGDSLVQSGDLTVEEQDKIFEEVWQILISYSFKYLIIFLPTFKL